MTKYRNSSGDEIKTGKQGLLNSHGERTVADRCLPVPDVPSDRSRLIFLVLFWTLTAIGLFFVCF